MRHLNIEASDTPQLAAPPSQCEELSKYNGLADLCDSGLTMHPHAFAGHQGDCIIF